MDGLTGKKIKSLTLNTVQEGVYNVKQNVVFNPFKSTKQELPSFCYLSEINL